MAYSRKASASQGESNIDWEGFNEHLVEVIGSVKSRVAVISGICDLGKQPRDNFKQRYDATKKEHIEALKDRGAEVLQGEFFENNKKVNGEYISIPQRPVDQVAIFATFPEVMVNYGKFFDDSGEDRFEPYTNLVMGNWWNKSAGDKGMMLAKGISLTCGKNDKAASGWGYDAKNTISRLAKNGVDMDNNPICTDAVVDQDFDIGSILGSVCMYSLGAEITKSNGKNYLNITLKDCAPKHEAVPVPKVPIKIFGASYEGGNDADAIKMIMKFKPLMNTLSLGEDWVDSGLKKDIDKMVADNSSSASASSNEGTASKGSATPSTTTAPQEDFEDFDDFDEEEMFGQ